MLTDDAFTLIGWSWYNTAFAGSFSRLVLSQLRVSLLIHCRLLKSRWQVSWWNGLSDWEVCSCIYIRWAESVVWQPVLAPSFARVLRASHIVSCMQCGAFIESWYGWFIQFGDHGVPIEITFEPNCFDFVIGTQRLFSSESETFFADFEWLWHAEVTQCCLTLLLEVWHLTRCAESLNFARVFVFGRDRWLGDLPHGALHFLNKSRVLSVIGLAHLFFLSKFVLEVIFGFGSWFLGFKLFVHMNMGLFRLVLAWTELYKLVNRGQIPHNSVTASTFRQQLRLIGLFLTGEELVEIWNAFILSLQHEWNLVALSVLKGELRLVMAGARHCNLAL